MKKIFTFFLFTFSGLLLHAQNCTPDPAYAGGSAGVYPLPYDPATNPDGGIDEIACIGQPYEFTFTSVSDTFIFQGNTYVLDSFILTGVSGLPEGLDFACEPSNCTLYFGEMGCMSIYGTPTAANAPGEYPLTINGTAFLPGFTFNLTFPNPSISPGTYSITLEDPGSPNCSGCGLSATTSVENASCSTSCDGSATIIPSGGTGPYEYLWDEASGNQTTATITNLCPGDYSVTVSDQFNCSHIETVTITANPDMLLSFSGNTSLNCFGDDDGSIMVTVKNGEAPFTYSWNTGDNSNSLNDLTAGSYSVTITDNNNCSEVASFQITQPTLLTVNASATDESAPNANDGSASANPAGGTPPYAFLWSNGSTNS
ncbi:MAG: hypothetical protein GY751_02735, partial [Bacteroidetes bacterium]|nr:hypothetical protein [Bacteroidota bacterium]